MELTFECPKCETANQVPAVESASVALCRSCGQSRPLHGAAFEAGALRQCANCATDDLYLQKDFPQGLGLLIVVVGFVIATVFWYFERPLATYAVLLASALVDLALYYRVPDVTICYRCLSQFRGAGAAPAGRYQPFDLGVGERYRQERLRVEELRRQHAPADAAPPV